VGDAEIAEHDLDAGEVRIAPEHEISRLEIAMDDAAAMRCRERAQDLAVPLDATAERSLAALAQHVA